MYIPGIKNFDSYMCIVHIVEQNPPLNKPPEGSTNSSMAFIVYVVIAMFLSFVTLYYSSCFLNFFMVW